MYLLKNCILLEANETRLYMCMIEYMLVQRRTDHLRFILLCDYVIGYMFQQWSSDRIGLMIIPWRAYQLRYKSYFGYSKGFPRETVWTTSIHLFTVNLQASWLPIVRWRWSTSTHAATKMAWITWTHTFTVVLGLTWTHASTMKNYST